MTKKKVKMGLNKAPPATTEVVLDIENKDTPFWRLCKMQECLKNNMKSWRSIPLTLSPQDILNSFRVQKTSSNLQFQKYLLQELTSLLKEDSEQWSFFSYTDKTGIGGMVGDDTNFMLYYRTETKNPTGFCLNAHYDVSNDNVDNIWDNRASCFHLLEMVREIAAKRCTPKNNILFSWTYGEESGLRGAKTLNEILKVSKEFNVSYIWNLELAVHGKLWSNKSNSVSFQILKDFHSKVDPQWEIVVRGCPPSDHLSLSVADTICIGYVPEEDFAKNHFPKEWSKCHSSGDSLSLVEPDKFNSVASHFIQVFSQIFEHEFTSAEIETYSEAAKNSTKLLTSLRSPNAYSNESFSPGSGFTGKYSLWGNESEEDYYYQGSRYSEPLISASRAQSKADNKDYIDRYQSYLKESKTTTGFTPFVSPEKTLPTSTTFQKKEKTPTLFIGDVQTNVKEGRYVSILNREHGGTPVVWELKNGSIHCEVSSFCDFTKMTPVEIKSLRKDLINEIISDMKNNTLTVAPTK